MSWRTSTKLGPHNRSWTPPAEVAALEIAAGAVFVVLTSEGEQGRFPTSGEAMALYKRIGGRAPRRIPGLRVERLK